MPEKDLAKALIRALTGGGSQADLAKAFSETLIDWVIGHARLTVAYTGVAPGGVPEAWAGQLQLSAGPGPVPVAPTGDWTTWLTGTGIALATYPIVSSAGPVRPVAPFPGLSGARPGPLPGVLLQSAVRAAAERNPQDPMEPVWETIGSGIIRWIIGAAPTVFPASLVGTGTGTISKIIFV